MCIIVYKPKGKLLKKEVYETCFKNNKDGAGFIVREKSGDLTMKKGYFTFEEFWAAFQGHQWKQGIIHFRITTHGTTKEENCHPFWVKEGELAFAHNGVISAVDCAADYTMSDTWHFNTRILQNLYGKVGPEFISDPTIQALITNYIDYSKLAFLDNKGVAWIFNKSKGELVNDVWFSNGSYKSYTYHNNVNDKRKGKNRYMTSQEAIEYMDKMADRSNVNSTTALARLPNSDGHTNLIPIKRDASADIRVHDYVELLYKWQDLFKGNLGKIIGIYGDYTAEVRVFQPGGPFKIRRIPFSQLRKYESMIDPVTGREFQEYNEHSFH